MGSGIMHQIDTTVDATNKSLYISTENQRDTNR
jgi:hypothetical protein